MRTIAYLYDSYETATEAARALEAAGFSHDDVSLVANQGGASGTTGTGMTGTGTTGIGTTGIGTTGIGTMATGATTAGTTGDTTATGTQAGTGAGTGASIGTLLGGGAGLLAGIGALAIPGVGPVIAAGWLVATLTGAGAGAGLGSLVGSLTGAGVPDEHAHVYAEGVRRGGTLLTVRADDARAAEADSIMQGFHPVDAAGRGASYRSNDGWSRFDETRVGLTSDELSAERMRVGRSTTV